MKRKKTYQAKASDLERKWYVVDAKEKVLGRLSTKVAAVLRGKNKVSFTPHVDTGDFVILINAQDVRVTGKKEEQKKYFSHSGYPGGDKLIPLKDLRAKKPDEILKHSIRGMLPKGRLGNAMFKKLKVYSGASHPHGAQRPRELKI